MPRHERTRGFTSETNGDKHTKVLASLERQLESVHDSESFQAYLRVQSRFYRYSFGNVMLIQAQRPDAMRVAGYKTWQALEPVMNFSSPMLARAVDSGSRHHGWNPSAADVAP